MKIRDWDLYLITEQSLSAGRNSLEIVREAAAAGVDVIQLRDKNLNLRSRFKLGKKIKEICLKHKLKFIVNDRVDLALALDADGVHLGQSDLPLKAARKVLGAAKIIGISAWKPEEIIEAEAGGADYLGVGAVFSTNSKKLNSAKNGIGLAKIAEIRKATKLPIVAIGGLTKENAAEVIKSGADCISVISALTQAKKVKVETKEFKNIISNSKKSLRGRN